MDFYISDSMQDIYDIDIRSEVATVVGGANEFSSLVNFDLPPLDLDSNSNDVWMGSSRWSFGSSSDIYADVGECVNPNAVMPNTNGSNVTANVSMLLKSPKNHMNLNRHHMFDSLLTSPSEKKSHLTFSPATIKLSQMKQEQSLINNSSVKRLMSINTIEANRENVKKDLSSELGSMKMKNNFKLAQGGVTFAQANGQKLELQKSHLKVLDNTIYSVQNKQKIQRSSSPKFTFMSSAALKPHTVKNVIHPSKIHHTYVTNGNHILSASNHHEKPVKKTKQHHPQGISEFPKPAYSYSCLIAMALKNSRAGSLPVSEIYSFMCEHFPYFKTAPNGWKNSVRHNLSLNKCFEKIEKPVTNGGQRKGCLWAMNPAKISKMDEEVQKWSRKDPMAIKKAMVFPENLEALERGEMKHGHSGESDDDDENDMGSSEENDDMQSEGEQEESFMNTPESLNDGHATSDEDVDFDVEVRIAAN
jgi:forkhead box protein N